MLWRRSPLKTSTILWEVAKGQGALGSYASEKIKGITNLGNRKD
ncbi:hypothetical protein [Nostoc sp. 'Peltigera membranacea cyanobiont' N6]|nr:hypothetical protein [Nostoc sp. 'Peltigera membranacea cyanobiont' N6]